MAMDKRVTKTNDAILDAFIVLARTRPLNKITITALAKAAGISRKTFYNRYSSIDQLIFSLRKYMVAKFKDVFIPPVDDNGDLNNDYIKEFLNFARDNHELISILKDDSDEFLHVAIAERKTDFTEFLISTGRFDKDTAMTIAPWLITVYFKELEYLITKWLFTDNNLSDTDMTNLIIFLFKSSIKAE